MQVGTDILAMVIDIMHVDFFRYEIVLGSVKNAMIFGADINWMVYIDCKQKYILLLNKGP